ncbi:alpha-L-fucosidase [Nonomuraea sp. NBC_01738]|uniref:alpha-L-fucosidase n=1 Tax=Nonomuraea sp. NBC_01738 TaxID=2976003 RepID=UPI002E15D249|nr:alpha-L-fucosidase [Nonomuraea sp. NBC_01738]
MYEPVRESLRRHEAPQWFEDAKFGVFVHMGPYSVPAWAPVEGWPAGSAYAEWYWKELNRPGSPTRERHRELYGEAHEYDDFLRDWKAAEFSAPGLVELILAGGARYYVFGAKHHDGVALWDTATTGRNSVALGPGRDFVAEMITATPPGLRAGLYYSLPEWFHPRMPEIGGGWFGDGPPRNAFTGEPVPYTGYRPIADYVRDHQLPQLKELADRFAPDVMWADIGLGGVNAGDEFLAHYFNLRPEGTVNNRFGNGVYDFTTPEYSVEPDIKPEKWEASRGVGRSYGFNAAEGPAEHLMAAELIHCFVDVVSKNGNLLLNLGPTGSGAIPPLQSAPLLALGAWLRVNGEAMYGSAHWDRADDPAANAAVRFTTQPHAFYVTALERPPGGTLILRAPVPVADGDTVTLLGHGPVGWTRDEDGVRLEFPAGVPDAAAHTFRVAAPGYDPATAPLLGVRVTAPPVAPGEAAELTVTLANRGELPIPSGELLAGGLVRMATPALEPHSRVRLPVRLPVGEGPVPVTVRAGGTEFTGGCELWALGESVPVALPYDNEGAAGARAVMDGPAVARGDVEWDVRETGGTGGFTGDGGTYPAEHLPPPGAFSSGRIVFRWPERDGPDNMTARGQRVAIPRGRRLHLLASAYGRWKPVDALLTVVTEAGDEHGHRLRVGDWRNPAADPIAVHLPFVRSPRGEPEPDGFVFHHTVALPQDAVAFLIEGTNVHIWAASVER